MADLPISSGGNGQTNTQSPQTSTAGDGASAQSGNIQPGTSNDLLKGGGSVPLEQPTLPTISLPNLNETRTTTSTSKDETPADSSHVNVALLGVSLLVLVVAALVFVMMGRSDKNTTI